MSRRSVTVRDPRIGNGNSEVTHVVLEGPRTSNYQTVNASNQSDTNQLTYTITPPSPNTGVCRYVRQHISGSAVVVGTNFTGLGNANVCLRPWPIASITASCNVQVNNSSITYGSMSQWANVYSRVQNPTFNAITAQSGTATAPDVYATMLCNSQNGATGQFDPAGQAARGDGVFMSRMCQITSLEQNNSGQFTVNFTIDEPLIVPPFTADSSTHEALFGVNNIVVTSQFTNIGKLLQVALGGEATLQSVNVSFSQAYLSVNYITMSSKSLSQQPIESIINAPQFQFFQTSVNASLPAPPTNNPASFTGVVISSQSVTLPVIPRLAIVWASLPTSLTTGVSGVNTVDTFLPITSASVQAYNASSVLAGATSAQLYEISQRNGLRCSQWQFQGLPSYINSVPAAPGIFEIAGYASGAPLVIDFARDLTLDEGLSPGMAVQSQFQIQCVVNNNLGATQYSAAVDLSSVNLNVLFVTDGILLTQGGASSYILGGITAEDVAKAKASAPIVSDTVTSAVLSQTLSGGSFMDFMKDFGSGFVKGLSMVGSAAKEILPAAIPIAKMMLGAGSSGGAISGGATYQSMGLRERLSRR